MFSNPTCSKQDNLGMVFICVHTFPPGDEESMWHVSNHRLISKWGSVLQIEFEYTEEAGGKRKINLN